MMITTNTQLKKVIPGSLSRKKLFFSLIIAVAATQAFGQANTSLSNLVNPTAINVSLVPQSFNSKNLGSSSKTWKDLYVDGVIYRQGDSWLGGNFTSFSTFVGQNAGFNCLDQSNSESNTFIGASAGYATTTGTANTFLGAFAGSDNTTGGGNVFLGKDAGSDNLTGNDNVFVGIVAGTRNTSGNYNVCLGYASGNFNSTGISNCFVGSLSGFSNHDGDYNSAFGESALYFNTSGGSNTAIGAYSLKSNTTGSHNTASGIQCLNFNTTGSFNTAAGRNALYQNTIGGYNTAIGYGSGGQNDNNTFCSFFGYDADQSVNSDFSNSTALGNSARITASNQVRIGNASVTSIGGYVGWSNLSDGRYKKDVREDVPGLDFINKLRPVTYHLDVPGLRGFLGEDKNDDEVNAESSSASNESPSSKEEVLYSGFIAQEVEKTAKEMGYDFSGVDAPKNENDLYGLRYAEFVVPLVKSVQELSVKNEELSSANENLQSIISNFATQLAGQDAKLKEIEARNSKLESQLAERYSSNVVSNDGGAKISMTDEKALPLLGQNIPNPFDNSTVIPFRIPKGCTSASIVISEFATGRMITVIPVSCSETHAMIEAGSLANGSYIYSLYVDGKVIDTKQMELLK